MIAIVMSHGNQDDWIELFQWGEMEKWRNRRNAAAAAAAAAAAGPIGSRGTSRTSR